jgi:hypothetical protein
MDESGWNVVDPFARALGLTFTIVLDERQQASSKYRTFRLPETFIIDKKGIIVDKRVGPADWADQRYIDYFTNLATK